MKELEDIIEDYKQVRQNFNDFTKKGDGNKATFIEFERRFIDLKADLQPWRAKLTSEWVRHDDKAATAVKYRIAVQMHRGNYPNQDKCSLGQAEVLAAASDEYQEFIKNRAFYKESYTNISDLMEGMTAYANLTKDYIK